MCILHIHVHKLVAAYMQTILRPTSDVNISHVDLYTAVFGSEQA
jgi:hypothetical protein